MLPLDEIYKNSIKDENDAIDRILSPQTHPIQSKSDKAMLWFYNSLQALGSFFLSSDINAYKQHFYRCGRIDEYLIKKFDARILDSGTHHLLYAVLSDCVPLMLTYADLGHSKYRWMVEHGHSTMLYAIQQVIKGDWEQLQWSLEIMAKKNQKLNKVLLPDRKFFEGMLNSDQQMVTDAIYLLLKDHKKRNRHMGIAQDYISIPALGYAKLAWLKGMEVEIDHPLIPRELLPVRPLPHYDDKYDFLKALNQNL
jgi:hypothetical protein